MLASDCIAASSAATAPSFESRLHNSRSVRTPSVSVPAAPAEAQKAGVRRESRSCPVQVCHLQLTSAGRHLSDKHHCKQYTSGIEEGPHPWSAQAPTSSHIVGAPCVSASRLDAAQHNLWPLTCSREVLRLEGARLRRDAAGLLLHWLRPCGGLHGSSSCRLGGRQRCPSSLHLVLLLVPGRLVQLHVLLARDIGIHQPTSVLNLQGWTHL